MLLRVSGEAVVSALQQRQRTHRVAALDVHRGDGHLDHALPQILVGAGRRMPDGFEALVRLEEALLGPQSLAEGERFLDGGRVVLLRQRHPGGVVGQGPTRPIARTCLFRPAVVPAVTFSASHVVLGIGVCARVTAAEVAFCDVPELPEVESIRRQLAPELTGRTVVSVWWDAHPHARFDDVHLLAGRRILDVRRRGKFLLCPLSHPDDPRALELVLHLGMTGSLRVLPTSGPGAPVEGGPDAITHIRASFVLDDDRVVLFRDPRRFGRVSVVPAGDYRQHVPTLAVLGPEPLSDDFDLATFSAGLARTSATVKAKLLDQRLVAGVGNIYADEALWRARIHPASRRVGRTRAAALHLAIREVLSAAVEREGTTFRDYQMVNGQSGRYADHLDAYGQGDLPCRRCGTTLRRTVVAQRGTTYCPRCQRA
jgi:formamidopyrimidine-DNA glycosylase